MGPQRTHGGWLLVAVGATLIGLTTGRDARAALVAYWGFNEGTGAVAYDASPNGNHATFANFGNSAGYLSWTTGHTGGAGDFALDSKGYSDFAYAPDSASFDSVTSTFTVAFWVRETFPNAYPYVLFTTNTANLGLTGDRRWFFQGPNGNGDQAYVWSDIDNAWKKPLGFLIPDNVWTHYALTYSGGQLTRYINGVVFGSPIAVGTNFPDFTGTFRIAGRGNGSGGFSSFEGYIDDVILFNSVEDVAAIMNGTHPDMAAEVVPAPGSLTAGLALLGVAALRRRR